MSDDRPKGGWSVSWNDFVTYCQSRIQSGQLSIAGAVKGMQARKPGMSTHACRKTLSV